MSRNDEPTTPIERAIPRKAMVVVFAGVLGLAVMGFSLGIRGNSHDRAATSPSGAPSPYDAPPAPTYFDVVRRPLGPNVDFKSTLALLAQPATTPPPAKPDPIARATALASRAARRAYDGAPPVIPHAVDARHASACIACHGEGLTVGDAVARKIPHPLWTQCTQCHVEQENRMFGDVVLAENTFLGFMAADFAHRATLGAPPVTPHPISTRQDCVSCHGQKGEVGLRTSHPERQNCLQCHPSAMPMDFRELDSEESFLPPPSVEGSSP